MQYLMQPPRSNLCGQTCVAMIADTSLQTSIYAFGKQGCTSTKDVIKALHSFGIKCGDSLIRVGKATKPEFCMVVLHFSTVKNTHWVVWRDGKYYDPDDRIKTKLNWDERETSFLPIYGMG